MATIKKLISYNPTKHPEVAKFFDDFKETNLSSHYVREAIKFYMLHKSEDSSFVEKEIPIQSDQVLKMENKNVSEPTEPKDEDQSTDKYESFDPNSIFN